MKEAISLNLKRFRQLASFPQEALAGLLGLSRATLSAIENGHVAVDSTRLLAAARILGRPVSEFLRQEGEALALLIEARTIQLQKRTFTTEAQRTRWGSRRLQKLNLTAT